MLINKSDSVFFNLEIVHGKKNLFIFDIVEVLTYLKTIFIHSKINSADITDHFGKKHLYRDGKFIDSGKFDKSPQISAWPYTPLTWKGSVDLNSNQLGDLINNISPLERKNSESYGYLWKFDDDSSEFRRLIESPSSKAKLLPECINFSLGNIVNGNCFVYRLTTQFDSRVKDLNVELDFCRNELNLIFTVITNKVTGEKSEKKVKLNYDCNCIKSVIVHHFNSLGFTLHAELAYPPKMFVGEAPSCGSNIGKQIEWKRMSSFSPISQDSLGKCNVLRLTYLASSTSYIPALYFWRRLLKFDLSFGTIMEGKNTLKNEPKDIEFPFKIRYALICLKSLSYNYQDDLMINHQGERVVNEFIEKQINDGKSDQVNCALNLLFVELANGKVHNVFECLKYLMNKVELEWEFIKDSERDTKHIKNVNVAILTPSRTIFMPPVMIRTCQFLDSNEADFVLRIIYRDENNGSLSSTFKNFESNKEKKAGDEEECVDCCTSMLEERILKDGLCVAGRKYHYFGASPSQLKEGGMILYAEDSKKRTAASIRESLGIVKEKTVPKYMSRIGLCLSQVMAFVDLPEYTRIYITPDIHGNPSVIGKSYIFTDGCGSLSLEAARYIYEDLIRQKVMERKDDDSYVPSAFQIRFMGCKGMLVVDASLTGITIVIRESMQKMFTKKDYRIGIVKVSEPRRAYLNKPFIMVLNQIGLLNDFFINLVYSTLRDLDSVFYDEGVASMTLKIYSYLHRIIDIEAFAKCKFSFTSDSFFKSILQFVVKKASDSLKTKQRIPLPWFEARTMFGVCDTTARSQKWLADEFVSQGICQPPKFPVSTTGLGTGVLKKGQIFFWPSDFARPYQGDVVVTKFPTSDLGGVRILHAVDCKELHAIRDCIVFPVDGERPHQDEMAGSDLDGDEYCVAWMDDILKIKERVSVEYPDNPKVETVEGISDELMIKHHINCAKADQAGQIANAQLAHADSKGFDSPVCLKLVPKYNGSLDAPKNGINPEYFIANDERALEAPDFMGKWSVTPTYYSTRASGEIHRLVDLHQISSNFLNVPAKFELDQDIDERLLHPEMLKHIEFAVESFRAYQSIIEHLLKKYGLSSEVELLTGISDGSFSTLHNESCHVKDKEDAMVATINSLLRNKMDAFFESKMVNKSEDEKMAAASAIYYASKQKVKDTNSYIGLPFIGKYGLYLRKYMESQKVITKNQNKTSTSKVIALYNQPSIKVPIQKIKKKLHYIIETFLSYGKWTNCKTLKNSPKFNKTVNQSDSIAIPIGNSPDNYLILDLIQETKDIWTSLVGVKNKELVQFINFTIPSLVRYLLLDETSLHQTQINKSDTKTFLVRCCRKGEIWKLLKKTVALDTQIDILFDSKEKNCIPVVIYGSPTSILVASIIIGIHNRLRSIYFKYYET